MAEQNQTDKFDIKYKRNFLTNVLCRLDFSPLLELLKEEPVDFQKRIRGLLPQYEKQTLLKYTTKFQDGKKIDENEAQPVYQFKSEDGKKKAVLNYESCFFECQDYRHFKEFSEEVKSIFMPLSEIYGVKSVNRLGLRYINQICLKEGNPLDWHGFISKDLTHSLYSFFEKDKIARLMEQSVLSFDDYKMNFTYGIYNSEFPAKVSRKEFILDFDCFAESVEFSSLIDLLTVFNRTIKLYFEKSIDDKLRAEMEIIDE